MRCSGRPTTPHILRRARIIHRQHGLRVQRATCKTRGLLLLTGDGTSFCLPSCFLMSSIQSLFSWIYDLLCLSSRTRRKQLNVVNVVDVCEERRRVTLSWLLFSSRRRSGTTPDRPPACMFTFHDVTHLAHRCNDKVRGSDRRNAVHRRTGGLVTCRT